MNWFSDRVRLEERCERLLKGEGPFDWPVPIPKDDLSELLRVYKAAPDTLLTNPQKQGLRK